MAVRAPEEIEYKLIAPGPGPLGALARRRDAGSFSFVPRRVENLHTVYIDTPELTLARLGIALRLRRRGTRWELTAKWGGSAVEGLHIRSEVTVPLIREPATPFEIPDGPLRGRLAALILDQPLRPILTTDIQRRRLNVYSKSESDDASPLAEIALDTVRHRGPSGTPPAPPYYEVEIELRRGQAADVAPLAQQLCVEYDLEPTAESKFSRALRLFHGIAPGDLADEVPETQTDN